MRFTQHYENNKILAVLLHPFQGHLASMCPRSSNRLINPSWRSLVDKLEISEKPERLHDYNPLQNEPGLIFGLWTMLWGVFEEGFGRLLGHVWMVMGRFGGHLWSLFGLYLEIVLRIVRALGKKHLITRTYAFHRIETYKASKPLASHRNL